MELAAVICLTFLLALREFLHTRERLSMSEQARDERRVLMNRIAHPEIYEPPPAEMAAERTARVESPVEDEDEYHLVGMVQDVNASDGR